MGNAQRIAYLVNEEGFTPSEAAAIAEESELFLTVAPFDHSRGVPEYTGMRGVMLDAPTGYQSARVFSVDFPTVFVTESGEVEVGEMIRVPRATAAAWFRAVADYLEPVVASSGEDENQ